VFVTGLLLDLFAVYFRPTEIRIFRRHLVRNRDCVGRLIADHKGYCEADYEEFERRFDETSLAKGMLDGFGIFLFWNQERRKGAPIVCLCPNSRGTSNAVSFAVTGNSSF
jgi:hypothetical protein